MRLSFIKKKRGIVFALAVTLAMSVGCAKVYEGKDSPKNLIIPAEKTLEAYSLNEEWWKLYQQDPLNQCVEIALKNNIDLARAALSVNRALYQARLISADLFPVFSSGASAQSSRDISRHASSVRSFQGNLSLNYELDLWGKVSSATSAQEWEAKATAEDLKATRLALIKAVTDTWFDIKYLNQALSFAKETAMRYEKLNRITLAKYEAGKVASVEPMETKQSLMAARNKVLSLQNELTLAHETMRNLLNLTPDQDFPENRRSILDIDPVPPNLDVPLATLAFRPDVAAAEDRLNSMFSSLKSYERDWFPKISIGGSISLSSDSHKTYFDVPFLSGLAKITFPFLDWNTLRWRTKMAEVDFEQAKLKFESTVKTAMNEIASAYAQYVSAKETLDNTMIKLDADQRVAEYYIARYNVGAAEMKDVLSAINSAVNSETDVLNAQYRMLSWECRIYQAMGGRFSTKN